jgi:hypothetical protein
VKATQIFSNWTAKSQQTKIQLVFYCTVQYKLRLVNAKLQQCNSTYKTISGTDI